MRKVKIIRATFDCNPYDDLVKFFPQSTDWEEVSEETYGELLYSVQTANRNSNNGEIFVLISYNGNEIADVQRLATEWLNEQKKIEAKREQIRRDAKARNDAKILERKRRQLEKLKKELENEN